MSFCWFVSEIFFCVFSRCVCCLIVMGWFGCLERFVVGMLGFGLKMKVFRWLNCIFWMKFRRCWKCVFDFFGKFVMKVECREMFGV